MPLESALLGPLLGAGSSILNMAFQGAQNNAQRKWSMDMYNRQRADALSDWNMQNQYNSPSSQMARLRDANLNPNLVYGNGNATTTASVPRGSSVESWKPVAPQFDSSSLMSYYDIQLKEAQTDNLKTANTVAVQDALLRAAQVAGTNASTAKTLADTNTAKFNLSQAQALQQVSIDTAKQQLYKMQADTQYTLDQNERAALSNAQTLRQGVEQILNMRAQRANTIAERMNIEQQLKNLQSDNKLKMLDINLKELGIQPGDSMGYRVAAQVINGLGIKPGDIKKFGEQVVSPFEWLKKPGVIDSLKKSVH